jgi:competence protein ComEA
MSVFLTVCAVITLYTVENEPQYIKFTPKSEESGSVNTPRPESRVNLNTADAEQLQSLYGIGEVLAGRIIDYREEVGAFLYIEEIMDVSGIGEKMFESIKDYIYI